MIDLALYRPEAASAETEARGALAELAEFPCETPEDESFLSKILIDLKGRAKVLEDRRKAITGPLNEAKRAVDDLFRPALNAFKEAEGTIKGKLEGAILRRRELAAAAQSAVAAGDHGALATLAEARSAQPEPGISHRWTWTYHVSDLDSVPREYLSVDYTKINAYLDSHGNVETMPPIPGIEFTKKPVIVARKGM